MYKSINYGYSWERIAVFDSYCYDLALDPLNSNIIFVLSYRSVFKSTDSGLSWNEYSFVSYFYNSQGEFCLAENNPNIIYASGRYRYDENSYKYCMAVCKSTDGGETWKVKEINPTSSWGEVEWISVSPLYSDIVYAGGSYRDENDTWHNRLYKSSDGGESWKDITGAIEGEPRAILINPLNSSKVYVSNNEGIYRSLDSGNTWQKNEGSAYANAIAIDNLDSNIIYAGYYDSLYKSVDGGVNWIRYDSGVYGSCNCLLIQHLLPKSSMVLLMGYIKVMMAAFHGRKAILK